MRPQIPAQLHFAAELGVALVLLAACGGTASVSQSSPSTPPSSPAAVSPATAKPTISNPGPASAVSQAPKPAAGASPAAAAKTLEPCSLITKDEAEATLSLKFDKTTVARGGSALGGHGADCNYEGALPSDPSLTLHTLTAAEFSADRGIPLQQWITLKKGPDTQPVSGLGDAAFWTSSLQTLDVAKGDVFMSLLAVDLKKKYQLKLDAATALAQKALAHV